MRISSNYNICNSYKNDEKQCDNKFNEILDKTKLNLNEVENNRKFLGRWILITEGINRGKVISIKYADDSTPEDPIMCTTTGERVKINDVNPNEATELEMRIYCAYLDSIGKGTGGTFGTYNDLMTVKATAHVNNFNPYGTLQVAEENMKNLKVNWLDLTKKVMDIVKSNDKNLYLRLQKLYEGV
ncbi:hypothetical protein [Crassaminicella indica]|uniref:Uncharacterized protein n=1 Tax=Crassaminicella indica TaxID=2855394 RepID=A0ABX8R9L5_9CLOT|nr:hypothetical protein [Crassaminicella indica]QXM05501.1 hypothetical protein KVH43_08935 [Crassaminicella indica]